MAHWRDTWLAELPDLVRPDYPPALGRDLSALTQFAQHHHGDLPHPGLAALPRTSGDVQRIIRLARRDGVNVVPRGGGSGVMQGIWAGEDSVVLDLSAMTTLGPLDAENGRIIVGAGLNLMSLETSLQSQGWTLGHWPQSISLATIGGLIATKSIGQYSARYGGIEDMVREIEVVLGCGDIVRIGSQAPRRSLGPELLPLFIGSEGTLGVIAEAALKVRPLPQANRHAAFTHADFSQGLSALQRWMLAGLTPALVRLYDPAETARTFAQAKGSLLLAIFEGTAKTITPQIEEALELSRPCGVPADPGLVAQWLATRNDVGAWAPLLQQGYLVDTIEVAGTWSILPDLYETIVRESHALAGVIGLTGHTSHVYADGANLYFTFLAHPQSPDQAEALYREIWSTAMNAALRLGATVSHHHGVGRIRREWMARERREELPWLLQIRKIFDPDGILNRGALWPNF